MAALVVRSLTLHWGNECYKFGEARRRIAEVYEVIRDGDGHATKLLCLRRSSSGH